MVYRQLGEEGRTKRRTIADVLAVIDAQGLAPTPGEIWVGRLVMPCGRDTILTQVRFPTHGVMVTLPASKTFSAKRREATDHESFKTEQLENAKVFTDGRVQLEDGLLLSAVTVVPTPMPTKATAVRERILFHVIQMNNAFSSCYPTIRERMPEDVQPYVPMVRRLDCSRLHELRVPQLKVIQAHIEDRDSEFDVSDQAIADALEFYGVRVPTPRPRRSSLSQFNAAP